MTTLGRSVELIGSQGSYFDEDKYADDGLEDDFFGEDTVLMQHDYQILTRATLETDQQRDLGKVSEVLGVSGGVSRILLMHYGWNAERLLTTFFEKGRDQVFKEAGVKDPDINKAAQVGTFTCPGCYDDLPLKNTMGLACGHRFCNECWTAYISMKIKEGQSRRIFCMGVKCNIVVDETLIPRFVDAATRERYNNSMLDSFVEDNPRIKWCPSVPHCGHAVRAKDGCGLCIDISCDCGCKFCFSCTQEAHAPCSCEMLKKWQKKCKDDSETVNYLNANTKDCPKCGKAIEKDGGCNLVTCVCGQYFCWLCGGPTGFNHTWTTIDGHSCSKYKEEQDKIAETAKTNLQRFGHYYERFQANDGVKKISDKLKKDTKEKSAALYTHVSAFLIAWLDKGLAQLFECRRILAFSYVFSYYMFGGEMSFSATIDKTMQALHKTLFEDHQQQLEMITEKLNKYLIMPVGELQTDVKKLQDIMNLTILADRRCKALFDIIVTDILGAANYGFQVANYIPYIDVNKKLSSIDRFKLEPIKVAVNTIATKKDTTAIAIKKEKKDKKDKKEKKVKDKDKKAKKEKKDKERKAKK